MIILLHYFSFIPIEWCHCFNIDNNGQPYRWQYVPIMIHEQQETQPPRATTQGSPWYATNGSRMQALHGSWTVQLNAQPRYWNLSCPIEWSKYSCVHQALSHARFAASQRFVPDNCALDVLDGQKFANRLRNRTVYFVGDSLPRQVMIAMTCALNVRESSIRANWPAYPNNTRPCHGTLNCIQCGPHSGFNNLEIRLEGGGILRYKRSVQSAPHFNHGDVVIVERITVFLRWVR
eukprot:99830_1